MARGSAVDGSIVLAHAAPFRLGEVGVYPPTRQLIRNGRSETLEPRVMQVLVALAEAQGAVLTRDDLIERCWGGRIVSENAINRVISRIRQLSADFGMDSFQLETITKVGYRMVVCGAAPSEMPPAAAVKESPKTSGFDRRWLLGGIAGASVSLIGALAWRQQFEAPLPAAVALYQKGATIREGGSPAHTEQALAYFREATRLDPSFADAWGALALTYANAASWSDRPDVAALHARSRSAAAQALRLDQGNADARFAPILHRPIYRNWERVETHLRAILADQPDHRPSRFALGSLLSEVGRFDESVRWLRPLAAPDQFNPLVRYRLIYALWNAGRLEEAEAALESAWARWPRHGAIWQARVKFLAHTGRPGAALAMIDDLSARPVDYPLESSKDVATIRALQSRAAADIETAVELWVTDVGRSPLNVGSGMQYCASLGAIDVAFALAEGHYLGRGPWANTAPPADGVAGPQTSLLFNTLTAAMRADPRFPALIRDIGLADYWRKTGKFPDYRLRI